MDVIEREVFSRWPHVYDDERVLAFVVSDFLPATLLGEWEDAAPAQWGSRDDQQTPHRRASHSGRSRPASPAHGADHPGNAGP